MITSWWKKVKDLVNRLSGPSKITLDDMPNLIDADDQQLFTEKTRYITPRVARVFRGIGALVVLFCYAIFQVTNILYLIVTGFIVALALERFIQFWQHRGCSRGFAMGLAYLILILFMLSGMVIMIPFIVTQLISLLQLTFGAIQEFQLRMQDGGLLTLIEQSNLPEMMKKRLADQSVEGGWVSLLQSVVAENISQIVTLGGESLKSAGSVAVNLVDSVLSALVQLVLIMTIAVFFSLERIAVFTFLAGLTKKPTRTYRTLQQLSTQLGIWLEGQLLLCVIIGVCVALGLWVISRFGIDLPNKFSLALIAGLTEFLPYIGPLLGSIPALLVALMAFGRKGFIITGLLYRAIQTAENNVIVPAVMSKKLGVNPLVIFLCMLLGASLFGFLGVLLSVPLALIVSFLVGSRGTGGKE